MTGREGKGGRTTWEGKRHGPKRDRGGGWLAGKEDWASGQDLGLIIERFFLFYI